MPIGLLEKLDESTSELDQKLEALTAEILRRSSPVEIHVFGSASRGTRRVGSDIDICVIYKSAKEIMKARGALFAKPLCKEPLDLIVLKKGEYDRLKNSGGICFEVYNHGRQLFPKIAA